MPDLEETSEIVRADDPGFLSPFAVLGVGVHRVPESR